MMLVLPYLFEINRVSDKWLSVAVLPLFLLSKSSFNPGQVFGLWYLSFSSAAENSCNLSIARFLTPLAASIIASWICQVYFPDDPQSWTRSRKSHKISG